MSGSFRPPRSPNIIWPSLSSILFHYGRQWPEMLTRPIPGVVVNFHLKIFNLGARRGGDVHFLIARLYIIGLDWIPNPSALRMLRRHILLLIAIRPSDGDVKPGGPLGAFREEQAMRQHRISPSTFVSSSSHTAQLHYTNSYTYSHPKLDFLQHCTDTLPTRNVVCPSGAWFENRPHLTQSIRLARNPKRVIVQWVGTRTGDRGMDRAFLNSLSIISSTDWLQTVTHLFRKSISCRLSYIHYWEF